MEKVGRIKKGKEHVKGCFGVGGRNRRGRCLPEFAPSNNFRIMNIVFEGSLQDKRTWKSAVGDLHSCRSPTMNVDSLCL